MPSQKKNKVANKLAKECYKSWWGLSNDERKKHNDLMRIQLLSPFLFSRVYQEEAWIEWAKSARLLSQKRIGALDDLTVDELFNTDLIELAITKLQDEIKQHKEFSANVTGVHFLEDIIDSINACQENESLDRALEKVTEKLWFKTVRSHLASDFSNKASKLNNQSTQSMDRLDAAVFLAAWQVSSYIKGIKAGEKPLDSYEQDSTLDKSLSNSKAQGNGYYSREEYSKAISKYTSILYAKPYIYIIYGNRAACYLKKREFQSALADGRRATTLNPSWEKGQYRYAQALDELDRSDAALAVLQKAMRVCKNTEELLAYQRDIEKQIFEEKKKKQNIVSNGVLSDNDGGNDDEWDDGDDSDCESLPELHTETEEESDDDGEADGDDERDNNNKDHKGSNVEKMDGTIEDQGVPCLISDSESNSEEDNGINERINVSKKKKILKKEFKSKVDRNLSSSIATEMKNDEKSCESNKKSTEQEKPKKKRRKKTKEKLEEPLNPLDALKLDLKLAMKEGSIALLSNQNRRAAHQYSKAVQMIQDNELFELIPDEERILLHYAHGVSHYQTGVHVDLNESLKIFKEINACFADYEFSLSYYGIGKVYCKQNRFDDAQEPLKTALTLSTKNNSDMKYMWPCSFDIIAESVPSKLKELVESLLLLCLNPPKPDGRCRFSMCRHSKTVIYFTDPDFKGFVRLVCTEKCFVEFHSSCWKKFRSSNVARTSDKEFLTDACVTPDCDGTVKKIEIYDEPNGHVKAEFEASLDRKEKKPYVDKNKRLEPSSELGFAKKMKKYNERIKKKEQQGALTGEENHHFKNEEDKKRYENFLQILNGTQTEKAKELDHIEDTLPVLDGDMYVLKHEEEDDILFQSGKTKKVKTKKAAKQKVTIDIPFVESEKNKKNDSRANNLFDAPSHLEEEISLFETEWEKNNDTSFKPYIIDNKDSIVGGFDFSVYNNMVPNAIETALHIFSMFEQILEINGSADIHTDKEILDFYNNILDDNSKLLITEIGGLRTFLAKCNRFSFDKENRNIVYLTSQEGFYKHCQNNYNRDRFYSPPPLEESIDEPPIHDFSKLFPKRPGYLTDRMNPKAKPFVPTQSNSESEESPKIVEITDNDIPPNTDIVRSDNSDQFYSLCGCPKKHNNSNNKTAPKNSIIQTDDNSKSIEPVITNLHNVTIDAVEVIHEEKPATVLGEKSTQLDVCDKESKCNIDSKSKSKIELESNNKIERIGKAEATKVNKKIEKECKGKPNKTKSDQNVTDDVKKKVEHPKHKRMDFGAHGVAEIFEKTKKTYSTKDSSGFSLCESIDYDVVQSMGREGVNVTVFENSKNSKVYIISDRDEDKHQLDLFSKALCTDDDERKLPKKSSSKMPSKGAQRKNEKTSSEQSISTKTSLSSESIKKCKTQKEMEVVRKVVPKPNSELCDKEIGNQVAKLQKELSEYVRKNENLQMVNKLLCEKKESEQKTEKTKIEKLMDDVRKQKVKYTTMHEKFQSEASDKRKLIEKMKKESTRTQQLSESELKKLSNDKKDLISQVKDLKKKLEESESRQERYMREIDSKESTVNELHGMMEDMRRRHNQEKTDQEEIMQRLTNSQSQQTQRAQKVEIALLEVKKDVVATKYRDQASVIQHTINQMQLWPQVPEAHKIRSIWEDYKKQFQSSYEKMQEEFVTLVQAVKDGQPLEQMPPAKYAEPPPYPNTPLMQAKIPPQLKAQQMQLMMAAQQRNRTSDVPLPQIQAVSVPEEQVPLSETPVAKLMVDYRKPRTEDTMTTDMNAGSAASGYDSDSEESEKSSNPSDEPKPHPKMLDRVIMRLATTFPNYTRDELKHFSMEYRRRHVSLSGMKFEDIVSNIERMIRTERQYNNQSAIPTKHQIANRATAELYKNKPKYSRPPAMYTDNNPAHSKRTRANHVPTNAPASNGEWWFDHPSIHRRSNIFGTEEPCVICYEDMTRSSSLKLHCGHVFHRNCISCWLNEQRTCPICRVHALLPDEYPALG